MGGGQLLRIPQSLFSLLVPVKALHQRALVSHGDGWVGGLTVYQKRRFNCFILDYVNKLDFFIPKIVSKLVNHFFR